MADSDPETQPPGELKLAWWCGDNLLPEVGGVLDQDYGLMQRMNVLHNVYRTVQRVRGMRGAEIHRLTDGERSIIKWLRDDGML